MEEGWQIVEKKKRGPKVLASQVWVSDWFLPSARPSDEEIFDSMELKDNTENNEILREIMEYYPFTVNPRLRIKIFPYNDRYEFAVTGITTDKETGKNVIHIIQYHLHYDSRNQRLVDQSKRYVQIII